MARKSKPVKKRPAKAARRKTPLQNKPDALDAFNAAAAIVPTQKAWLPAIKANLRVTLQHAKTVSDFKLPDTAEPAPVFKA